MSVDSDHLPILTRGWRRLSALGLAIPLTIGLALVVLVAMTLVSDGYKAPQVLDAGAVEDYDIGVPHEFEHDDFWLVRTAPQEFVAIYDRDPVSGCALVWGPGYQALGRTGWFRDACTTSTYDLTGACFDGPCGIGLNTYDIKIENGRVTVDPRHGSRGLLRQENGDPVNPPQ
jgi:nitrite reductase/ring-hydroxylating ferredoxin subunit